MCNAFYMYCLNIDIISVADPFVFKGVCNAVYDLHVFLKKKKKIK